MTESNFHAAEFLALPPSEQVKKCRQLAEEAEKLSRTASLELRANFADIARHWHRLADEIMRTRAR